MLQAAPHAVTVGTTAELQRVRDMDVDVDSLYAATLDYIRQLAGRELTQHQSAHIHQLLTVARDLESMGDLIETNLVTQGLHRLEYGLEITEGTLAVLQPLCNLVTQSLDDVLKALAEDDSKVIQLTIQRKPEIDKLARHATEHLGQRLLADEPNRIHAFSVEADIVSQWKRLYYYTKRIAKALSVQETGQDTERA
jgi:phosphate:Na+ symporter